MNIQATLRQRRPLKLKADGFWMLKQAGTFSGYAKAELLSGEISGVPLAREDAPESDVSVPIKLRVEDFTLLAERGFLDPAGKTELIDGLVYEVSPQYRPHGFLKDEFAYRLRRRLEELGSPLHVATEQSVAMPPHSEPQPDIVLTTEPRGNGPIPVASVALLVEISASTLRFDLTDKATVYAGANVPEYWIVDVEGRTLHQSWSPDNGSYTQHRTHAFGETLQAATIATLSIKSDAL